MPLVKTATLMPPALDWAVATIEGYGGLRKNPHAFDQSLIMNRGDGQCVLFSSLKYATDWSLGGPIVEREGLELKRGYGTPLLWAAFTYDRWNVRASKGNTGPTALIAAMRAHVARKLGDTIDIPDELL